MIRPIHSVGGIGKNIFLREMIPVLNNIFPGFDMPKFIVTAANGVIGNRKYTKEYDQEKDSK